MFLLKPFLFPQTLGLGPFFSFFFFVFCYCSFVCAGCSCLESCCCHGNGRMAFCSGLNSKNRAEKKNITLQLSLSISLPLLNTKGTNEVHKKNWSLIPTPTQTFATITLIKWLFPLSSL